VVLPGPPRELQPMWEAARKTAAFRAAVAGATEYRQSILRMFGIPESEIAASLRAIDEAGVDVGRLEVTTCLRRGEIELATRWEPGDEDVYRRFEALIRERHADTLFSEDGTTIDQQVAALLRGPPVRTLAVAESCTGGLMSARLTDFAGASEWFLGGVVPYSDAAKRAVVGVPGELIERHGAVSPEVARALAEGAIARFEAAVGVGITGIAGPGGGSPEKPVGLVCFCVAEREGGRIERSVNLPGGRVDIRDRSTTVAMHLLRRLLHGDHDAAGPGAEAEQARA
jgi:nicotinamide-nucleotide amidase